MGTKHTQERDTRDARYDSLFLGEVIENVDPEKHDRVRVLIPGLLEPKSCWAFPMGRMFGVKNGIHWIPEVGANVIVFLNQGDVDHPYYMPGPWGAPGGVTDQGEQYPQGSVDHLSVRWRGFHVTIDGTGGSEKLTVEDLDSGTKLEIDKTTGDYLRDVEGEEVVNVKGDRTVTVEEGSDAKVVTAGDLSETITTGNKDLTMPVGSETKTLTLGGSTETMPAGVKTISALTITLIASGAVNVTAGGAVTVAGQGVSVTSTGGGASVRDSTGTTLRSSTGLVTETLLGSFAGTVAGAFARAVIGALTYTVTGIFAVLAAVIQLGNGPFKKLATEDFVNNKYNLHTHPGVMAGGASTGVPSLLGAAGDLTSDTTAS